MGFLSNLFSGGGQAAGEAVKGTLQGVGSLATDIRSAITGDLSPADKAAIQQKTLELEQAVQTAQAAINQAEAASPRLFVAGWRPFVGWVCGSALAINYVVKPIAQWIITVYHSNLTLPTLDLSTMMPVLIGMLGLGVMRTVEKNAGSQGNH